MRPRAFILAGPRRSRLHDIGAPKGPRWRRQDWHDDGAAWVGDRRLRQLRHRADRLYWRFEGHERLARELGCVFYLATYANGLIRPRDIAYTGAGLPAVPTARFWEGLGGALGRSLEDLGRCCSRLFVSASPEWMEALQGDLRHASRRCSVVALPRGLAACAAGIRQTPGGMARPKRIQTETHQAS